MRRQTGGGDGGRENDRCRYKKKDRENMRQNDGERCIDSQKEADRKRQRRTERMENGEDREVTQRVGDRQRARGIYREKDRKREGDGYKREQI